MNPEEVLDALGRELRLPTGDRQEESADPPTVELRVFATLLVETARRHARRATGAETTGAGPTERLAASLAAALPAPLLTALRHAAPPIAHPNPPSD